MKRIKHVLFIIAAIVVGSGCKKDADFLKEVTETSYTLPNAFSVSSQVNDIVTELYYRNKRLQIPNNNDGWFLNGQGTDAADYGRSTNSAGSAVSVFSNWSANYGRTAAVFNGFYGMIGVANLALQGAEEVTWANENDKKLAVAQARFFRGYCYLNLGELFGGVPLVQDFIETPKFNFQRSTREETYLFAIADLEAATKDLLDHPEAGRAGKGVAYHYTAEAYLALATIRNNDVPALDKSIAAANEVMKLHSLMTTRFGTRANAASTNTLNGVAAYVANGDVFFDLFQRGNLDFQEGNREGLWVDQNDIAIFNKYNQNYSFLGFPQGFAPVLRNVAWLPARVRPGAGSGPWNGGGIGNDQFNLNGNISAYIGGRSQARVEPTKYARNTVWINNGNDLRNSAVNIRRDFEVKDPKHNLFGTIINEGNIAQYATTASIPAFYPIYTKVVPLDDWGYDGLTSGENRSNTYVDFYFVRIAETYLLRAEAKMRKSDLLGASMDINAVRSRAKATDVSPAQVNLNYILDERLRELWGEERRWNTLLRMGGTVARDRIIPNGLWIKDFPTYSGTINWNLFPIPLSVIDANLDVKIEQNPGWE